MNVLLEKLKWVNEKLILKVDGKRGCTVTFKQNAVKFDKAFGYGLNRTVV